MTGNGTKDNPYICSTWQELQSVTGSVSQNYVKMADLENEEDKIIDFLEIQPDGFTGTVYLHGFIDFNNWTFKNFYSVSPTTAISIGGHQSGGTSRGGGLIANLKMKNFFHNANSPADTQLPIHFLSYTNAEKEIAITNCEFYGELNYNNNVPSGASVSAESFISFDGTPEDTRFITIEETGLNIKANCNRRIVLFGIHEMKKCRVKLDISAASTTLITGGSGNYTDAIQRVKYCHFSGYIVDSSTTAHNVVVSGELSSFNVYDIESNVPLEYKGGGISVFNSQKASPSTYDTVFVGLTSEQLQNSQILLSAGFPCEVNENGNN